MKPYHVYATTNLARLISALEVPHEEATLNKQKVFLFPSYKDMQALLKSAKTECLKTVEGCQKLADAWKSAGWTVESLKKEIEDLAREIKSAEGRLRKLRQDKAGARSTIALMKKI